MASAWAVEGLAVEGLAAEALAVEGLASEGLAIEALTVEVSAVEAVAAPAFASGDSSIIAWLEFPSDLMAGGNTGTAKTCPGSFWGSLSGIAPLDEPTSVDAAATFSAGATAEPCAEALPVRRKPNPRTRASSATLAKARAARQNHPLGRSGGCGFSLARPALARPPLARTGLARPELAQPPLARPELAQPELAGL